MKPASLLAFPPAIFTAFAIILLAPPSTHALELKFVFEGALGTFRRLAPGVSNGFPPGEVEISFASSSGSAKGLYATAPRCLLPDCGFVSVTVDGSKFTTPAFFHGHNAGWQLLITSSPPNAPDARRQGAPSTSTNPLPDDTTLYGSLIYCPGYEQAGDLDQCPIPGPGLEPMGGRLDPPPRGDPTDPSVPGPLSLLGVAAAFRFSRKLKSRIRATPQR
ncbi:MULTISPECIES: hypothetical protein [unclassified Cyanobium]|uniref:hypothetical protein n=1 Tax=unclassified Cyanobium TaxID=2627006 RepID=UPI0020CE7606|nr:MULTISPECIES: hypothetical protein [unclassified Cyanobium]MCP9834933.1 hypothetical protein [Cyanobium sp. La Preciosa 7G6]MCP9937696.1 hypothetical protein [Cyanobium sp. Aljojuca 7A6]